MNLYKQIVIVAFFYLTMSAVQAEQSISIEWSKSDAYYAGQNRHYFYKPKTTSIYYSLGLNESWSLGTFIWRSDATENLDTNQFRLDEHGSGAAININYLYGNWHASLGLSTSETNLDIRSPVSTAFYEEQSETRDFNLSLAYLFSFDRFDISPSFGLGSQKFKQESNGVIPSVILSRDAEQTSTYAFADLVLSTGFELSQASIVQPSIQLGWTEALSGESSFTTRVISRGQPLRPNNSESNINTEASGYISIALSLLIDDFQLRLSHSKTLALDINSETSALEFGVFF